MMTRFAYGGARSKQILTFVISITLSLHSNGQESPIVEISNGRLQGRTLQVDVDGTRRDISTFLGIPFGSVPQRFSAPQEALPWIPKTLNVTEFGPSCYHVDDEVFPGFSGAEIWNAPNEKLENCLYLNVWTPSRGYASSNPAPVMVWIYGGSFYSGTSALRVYNGKYLAAFGQVVVVSFNYRLGPLGFLASLGQDAPGNVGLLDQNLALRWVKKNIEQFGGDPQNVTLLGESAGAASIGLHSLSPSSRGLFKRIILQSASQMTPWASIDKRTALSRARQLASNVGCKEAMTMAKRSLLNCLRSKSPKEIFDASWITTENFDFPFLPVHGTEFLPEDPIEMTRQGRHANVDILAGFNTNEGFYFALYTLPGFFLNTSSLITKGEYLSGIGLSGLRTTELGRSAAAFMYDDWDFPYNPSRYRDALDKIIGHFHVTCPVIRAAKLHSSIFPSSNVFLYHFDYRISNNPWPHWMGVMHGYEIELVFGLPFLYRREYNNEDRQVSKRMMLAWINFAKHGNPGGAKSEVRRWPKYDTKSQSYVEISSLMNSFRTPTPHAFECAFWEKYLPSLELASTDIDDMKAKWIVGFNRWSDSMNEWESAKARHEKCDESDSSP